MFMVLIPVLWFSCIFGRNTSDLVKDNSKQDGNGPDTIIIRPLETDISFQKLSLEYKTLFFIISAMTPYTQELANQMFP